MRTPLERFWIKTEPRPGGCVVWTAANDGSYGLFQAEGTKKAHRWIFEQVKGPIAKGLVVRHTCDVRLCVNPEHLELGTPKDNAQDRTNRGRWIQVTARGQSQGHAVLTEEKVRAIRRLSKLGVYSQRCLADAFGVHQSTVSQVVRHKTWRHV